MLSPTEQYPTGELLILVSVKSLAHKIQRGIEQHFHLLSNVVQNDQQWKDGTWEVRVVTKMNKASKAYAYGYALGMLDAS